MTTTHPSTITSQSLPLSSSTPISRPTASSFTFRHFFSRFRPSAPKNYAKAFPDLPPPSQDRLDASVTETPLDFRSLSREEIRNAEEKGKTVLYLAYGSNLCKETFREKRGIRPLSQVNVLVPELRLTFDLPGVPYAEPCFANSAMRDPSATKAAAEAEAYDEVDGQEGMETRPLVEGTEYHKDRWHKGMVGCVYEVTPSDYAHIIATEGGGSAYKDILVNCYLLPDSDTVPSAPTSAPFKAHTLFAPVADTKPPNLLNLDSLATGRFSRPDPSYAQPSARYLKLITDGARELSLPAEYQKYLSEIRPYTITTRRQGMGQKFFLSTWFPFLAMVFALQAKFQDDKGRSPKWLTALSGMVFLAMWTSYDVAYKRVFGDGERTEGQGEDAVVDEKAEEVKSGWFWRRKDQGGCRLV